MFHLGPGVTHNQVAAHNEVVEKAFPLASARGTWAPRRYATVGRLPGPITASPAN